MFFNRDESKERSIAEPPAELVTESGTRFLMPTDLDAGGTWMFVNERGGVVTLLNWYDKAVPYAEKASRFRSRGLLVKELADVRDLGELENRLVEVKERAPYRPFHLLGFAPNSSPCGWSWDGKSVSKQQGWFIGKFNVLLHKRDWCRADEVYCVASLKIKPCKRPKPTAICAGKTVT